MMQAIDIVVDIVTMWGEVPTNRPTIFEAGHNRGPPLPPEIAGRDENWVPLLV